MVLSMVFVERSDCAVDMGCRPEPARRESGRGNGAIQENDGDGVGMDSSARGNGSPVPENGGPLNQGCVETRYGVV